MYNNMKTLTSTYLLKLLQSVAPESSTCFAGCFWCKHLILLAVFATCTASLSCARFLNSTSISNLQYENALPSTYLFKLLQSVAPESSTCFAGCFWCKTLLLLAFFATRTASLSCARFLNSTSTSNLQYENAETLTYYIPFQTIAVFRARVINLLRRVSIIVRSIPIQRQAVSFFLPIFEPTSVHQTYVRI